MGYRDEVTIDTLVGKTIETITGDVSSDELVFDTAEGNSYKMYHSQDCCEHVSIEDIAGDLNDLIGSPILSAEEVSNTEPDAELIEKRKAAYEKAKKEHEEAGNRNDFYSYSPSPESNWCDESETWTFYKLSTIKGSVTIRWYGSSNGYYSERVSFEEI